MCLSCWIWSLSSSGSPISITSSIHLWSNCSRLSSFTNQLLVWIPAELSIKPSSCPQQSLCLFWQHPPSSSFLQQSEPPQPLWSTPRSSISPASSDTLGGGSSWALRMASNMLSSCFSTFWSSCVMGSEFTDGCVRHQHCRALWKARTLCQMHHIIHLHK